ncbi:MAG TPA: murein biosynthesis integral membrane protein MurJ [Candidatus Omnitrophica bacterium]|nr:murein biosynthesis integral membrane protein MurJ [Candidatus Omnitrophota bacterium]
MENSLKTIGRNAGIVSSGIAVSRIFGFLRDALIAFFFADRLRDIFFLILTIPNFSRRFFGEGALSSAFIPIFSESFKKKDKEDAWRVASSTVNIIFIVLAGLTLIGVIFSPLIIRVVACGFSQSSRELAVPNLRIMFPFMIFICLQAIYMGMLHSLGHFSTPSLAPIFFNLSIISMILLFKDRLNASLIPLSFGVVIGGFLQMLIQIPPLIKRGYRHSFHIEWNSSAIRKMFRLMGPALLGVGVLQINIVVDRILASFLPEGGISALWYSNRLVQLPFALFGISIAQATFPALAAQAADEESLKIKKTVLSSLSLSGFTAIPSFFALVFFGKPLINLLFQRGQFTAISTDATYFALIFYATGLFAFAGTKIVANAFHSLKDTSTPLKIGIATVGVNIVMDLALLRPMQQGGLALATSLASFFNFALLVYYLERRLGKFNISQIVLSLSKVTVASCVMSIVLWIGSHFLYSMEWNIIKKVFSTILILPVGIGGYFICCYFLRVPEVRLLKDIFRSKNSKINKE